MDPKSRGGSKAVHEDLESGQILKIGRPRNNFPLISAPHTLLFAGGIGITPMLSMAYALEAQGASWELHYAGRSMDRFAFLPELKRFGSKVHLYRDDGPACEKLDAMATLSGAQKGAHLYACGPNGFMNFIVKTAEQNGFDPDAIHLERFGAEIDTDGAAFTVVAEKSGIEIKINPGETISEKLMSNGIDVSVSCQSGVCGTCLTKVIKGTPDHRDLVQTDAEKAANAQITICCSRSKTKTLILDI
ncbi:MAG: PDR/VanB family oxidoreductase [Pseudomonadota bacterium]